MLNYTTGQHSTKHRLWEPLQKQRPDFFNKNGKESKTQWRVFQSRCVIWILSWTNYLKINEKMRNLNNKYWIIVSEVIHLSTSSQDGGVGRYVLLPHTTKRTTNLKIKNHQNWQKIKLYVSLTTKELKNKHSSRLVGGAERMHSKAAVGGPGDSTYACR